jgi:hypothetical protein
MMVGDESGIKPDGKYQFSEDTKVKISSEKRPKFTRNIGVSSTKTTPPPPSNPTRKFQTKYPN